MTIDGDEILGLLSLVDCIEAIDKNVTQLESRLQVQLDSTHLIRVAKLTQLVTRLVSSELNSTYRQYYKREKMPIYNALGLRFRSEITESRGVGS